MAGKTVAPVAAVRVSANAAALAAPVHWNTVEVAPVRVSANAAALALSETLGRPLTAKQVRDMARDVLPEHDKTTHPAYTGHAYDAAQLAALREAFAARGSRGRGGANDADAARAMLAPKPDAS